MIGKNIDRSCSDVMSEPYRPSDIERGLPNLGQAIRQGNDRFIIEHVSHIKELSSRLVGLKNDIDHKLHGPKPQAVCQEAKAVKKDNLKSILNDIEDNLENVGAYLFELNTKIL